MQRGELSVLVHAAPAANLGDNPDRRKRLGYNSAGATCSSASKHVGPPPETAAPFRRPVFSATRRAQGRRRVQCIEPARHPASAARRRWCGPLRVVPSPSFHAVGDGSDRERSTSKPGSTPKHQGGSWRDGASLKQPAAAPPAVQHTRVLPRAMCTPVPQHPAAASLPHARHAVRPGSRRRRPGVCSHPRRRLPAHPLAAQRGGRLGVARPGKHGVPTRADWCMPPGVLAHTRAGQLGNFLLLLRQRPKLYQRPLHQRAAATLLPPSSPPRLASSLLSSWRGLMASRTAGSFWPCWAPCLTSRPARATTVGWGDVVGRWRCGRPESCVCVCVCLMSVPGDWKRRRQCCAGKGRVGCLAARLRSVAPCMSHRRRNSPITPQGPGAGTRALPAATPLALTSPAGGAAAFFQAPLRCGATSTPFASSCCCCCCRSGGAAA